MIVKCSNCGEDLELPDGLSDGQHLKCPLCGEKFVMQGGAVASVPIKAALIADEPPCRPARLQVAGESSRPEPPKLLLVGIIGFYILTALGFVGTASRNFIAAMSVSLMLGGLTLGMQRGFNWARISMTILVCGIWIMTCSNDVFAGLVILLLWAAPLVLIWLPSASIWFREMAAFYVLERIQNADRFAQRNKVIKMILALLLGLIFVYVSGLLIFAMWDGQGAFNPYGTRSFVFPDHLAWGQALLAFIPLFPLCAFFQFVGSMFCSDMPFWLGVLGLLSTLIGWGSLGWGWKELKKFWSNDGGDKGVKT